MTLTALAGVQARIAEIESRIGATHRAAGFAATLDRVRFPSRTQETGPAVNGEAGTPGEWAAALPEAGRQWAGPIQDAAREAGVDPRLLAALTWAESGFQAGARSHAGAQGLTQLMPGTAAGLGVDPADPVDNLRGGARYLREQLDRFGDVDLALAAYNAGPGRVAQAGGVPRIPETQAYVPRVLSYFERLGGVR